MKKQTWKKSEKRRRKKIRKRERVSRKKMQVREKVENSRITETLCFSMFCGKGGSLKWRVRSHLARWEMKNCTPLWREAHSKSKLWKTCQVRSTFGHWNVDKNARRCGAKHMSKWKKMEKTDGLSFWKLSCWKSARHGGAQQISKSKCAKSIKKRLSDGARLEVGMLKKCTPLWRKAHVEDCRIMSKSKW